MTFRDFCTGFRDYWPNFVAKHWNFSQCRNGYSAGYTPKYPKRQQRISTYFITLATAHGHSTLKQRASRL